MKIAVTGAAGHLGNLIVRELLKRGYAVNALVRSKNPGSLAALPVCLITGDIDNQNALAELMQGCHGVVHAAAVISIAGGMNGLVHRTNVSGTKQVMDAARKAGVKRVIHISSIHAFRQAPVGEVLDEKRALAGAESFAYDQSKSESQKIALSYASGDMDVLVMCPTSVVAPFDFKPSKLGTALIQMCSGKLPFVFRGGYDFCDGRDIAFAVANGLTKGENGNAYILGGSWCDLDTLYMMVTEAAGKPKRPYIIPTSLAYAGMPFVTIQSRLTRKDPLYTHEAIVAVTQGNKHISIEKAKSGLDYQPRPLAQTIQDTYSWFRENGYLGK
jgi:dihydroflavonol-4-reductase